MEKKLDFVESIRFVLECYETNIEILGIDPWYIREDGKAVEMALRGMDFSRDETYSNPDLRMMASLQLILREKELGAYQFLFVI